MTDEQKEFEEFEKWWSEHPVERFGATGSMKLAFKGVAWAAWLAAIQYMIEENEIRHG